MNRLCRTALLTAVMALVQLHAHAQLTNGSFENGNFTGSNPFGANGLTDLNPGDTNMTGWTVVDGEITWQEPGFATTQVASDGNRWLDLTGGHDHTPEGGVQQSVSLIVGHSYRLGFDIGYNVNNPTAPDSVIASVAGISQTFNNDGSGSGINRWKTFTLDFTPTTVSNTITLQGLTADGQTYIGLDNVTLVDTTPNVPEPGAYAMLMGCSAVLAFMKRRRK